ncbi:MAG: hypothetical protein ABIQ74_11705 [Chitinophagales bacterium]
MEKHYNLYFLQDYYGEDVASMSVILRMYLEETPKELKLIENHLISNHGAEAKMVTHKIKTSIALLGIADPVRFIERMHQAAGAEVTKELIDLFVAFRNEVFKGLADIEKDFFSAP